MNASPRRRALITGASSGIGYELARCFAEEGHDLVLVARSGDALQRIARDLSQQYGIEALAIEKDLFDPRAAREIYEQLTTAGMEIEYLVNDAGQGVYGKFVETDLAQELDIIQLNIASVVVLTKLFLRDMVARGHGRVLQLASTASKNPAPYSAIYSATKAFIYNFSQALVSELEGTGVTVTSLRPGPTDTDFFRKEGAEDSKMVQEGRLGPPHPVAVDGYHAMMRGQDSVVSGWQNKVMDKATNLLMTDKAATKVMKKMHEPAHPPKK